MELGDTQSGHGLREPKGAPSGFTKEEAEQLIKAAETDTHLPNLIRLAVKTGMRDLLGHDRVISAGQCSDAVARLDDRWLRSDRTA